MPSGSQSMASITDNMLQDVAKWRASNKSAAVTLKTKKAASATNSAPAHGPAAATTAGVHRAKSASSLTMTGSRLETQR